MSSEVQSSFIICRTCLSEVNSDETVSLFKQIQLQNESLKLSHMIYKITNLKFTEEDTLPKVLCSNCVYKTCEAYFFRKKCLASQEMLEYEPSSDNEKFNQELKNLKEDEYLYDSKPTFCEICIKSYDTFEELTDHNSRCHFIFEDVEDFKTNDSTIINNISMKLFNDGNQKIDKTIKSSKTKPTLKTNPFVVVKPISVTQLEKIQKSNEIVSIAKIDCELCDLKFSTQRAKRVHKEKAHPGKCVKKVLGNGLRTTLNKKLLIKKKSLKIDKQHIVYNKPLNCEACGLKFPAKQFHKNHKCWTVINSNITSKRTHKPKNFEGFTRK